MWMIDADELKKPLVDWLNWYSGSEAVKGIVQEIVEDIDNAKTIEAEPVRHGRWVYDPNGMDFNLGAWVCSECKERNNNLGGMRKINPYSFVGSRFCPNCGAKMDLKE